MGWLDFFASVIGSLAWPIAATVIALAFRKQISGLFNKVRRLSWGDTTVELAEQLDKVETNSQEIAELPNEPPPALPTDRFQQLVEISPSVAILDSWRNVEQMLRMLSSNVSDKDLRPMTASRTAKVLHEKGMISASVFQMIRDLQGIRNVAAHHREVSPIDAYRFYELAEKVAKALNSNEV